VILWMIYLKKDAEKMVSGIEHAKGVVLVRCEDGSERILPKNTYLRMKNSGRKIVLLKEGKHWCDLR